LAKAALAARCAANDGERPSNFTIDKASTHHYAVTPIDGALIVLTGGEDTTELPCRLRRAMLAKNDACVPARPGRREWLGLAGASRC
jgi:hypothetical protein